MLFLCAILWFERGYVPCPNSAFYSSISGVKTYQMGSTPPPSHLEATLTRFLGSVAEHPDLEKFKFGTPNEIFPPMTAFIKCSREYS